MVQKNHEFIQTIAESSPSSTKSISSLKSPKAKTTDISLQLQAMSKLHKRIVFPCYGSDGLVYRYIFHFDDDGLMVADFNATIPPPVVVPMVDQAEDIIPAQHQSPELLKSPCDSSVIAVCAEHRHETSMLKLRQLDSMTDESREELRHDMFRRMQFLAEMYANRQLSFEFIVKVLQDFHELDCVISIELICKLLQFAHLECSTDERIVSIVDDLAAMVQLKLPRRVHSKIGKLLEKRELQSLDSVTKLPRRSTSDHT